MPWTSTLQSNCAAAFSSQSGVQENRSGRDEAWLGWVVTKRRCISSKYQAVSGRRIVGMLLPRVRIRAALRRSGGICQRWVNRIRGTKREPVCLCER